MSEKAVSKITVLEDIIQVELSGVSKNSMIIADIFNIIASKNVDIDMISEVMLEDDVALQITCDQTSQKQLNEAIEAVRKKYQHIVITQNRMVSKVLVEGEGMRNTPGVAAGLFSVFGRTNIYILQVSTSLTSIDFLVHKKDINIIAEAIKKEYQL